MKTIIIMVVLALTVGVAMAGDLDIMPENQGWVYIQGFNPRGDLTQTALINSVAVIDLSTSRAFSIYCASDAKFRTMPAANSTKATYKLSTIQGGSPRVRVKNGATPFLHISTATANPCELERN